MRHSNVQEGPRMRANTLPNQLNPKKGSNKIQPEKQNVYNKIKNRCQIYLALNLTCKFLNPFSMI